MIKIDKKVLSLSATLNGLSNMQVMLLALLPNCKNIHNKKLFQLNSNLDKGEFIPQFLRSGDNCGFFDRAVLKKTF